MSLVPEDLPDAVYVDEGVVHMTWLDDEKLPAAGDAGVAILYSQGAGVVFTEAVKTLGAATDLTPARVRGVDALWISGAPHSAELGGHPVRLAANALIWEENGIAHRIETTGDLDETLELAESLR